MKYGFTAALLGAIASSAQAHSWVEQLMVIGTNGTFTGAPGFPRAYIQRSNPAFSDTKLVWLIPPGAPRQINDIQATDRICRPEQTTQTQGADSPRLQAAAGAMVALRYQENGHVSLPQTQAGKPDNRGTVYIYGTTDSKPDDSLLSIHRQWTPDGQGGDKRGILLATRNYDDGQCYQTNNSPITAERVAQFKAKSDPITGTNVWCQNDIQIPTTATSGKPYTLYWVWDWPTLPGTAGFPDGKQEIYTTCMDIDITGAGKSNGAKSNGAASNGAAVNFVQGQDIVNAAIPNQFSNIANPTLVTGQSIAFKGQATGAVSSGTSSVASTSLASSTFATVSASPGDAGIPTVGPDGSIQESTSKVANSPTTITTVVSSTSAVATSTLKSQPASNTVTAAQPDPTTSRGVDQGTRPVVSPMPGPGSSASANPPAGQNTATAVANGQPTVTVTANASKSATVTQISTLISYIIQTHLETVTAAPMSTGNPEKREVLISTTERAYRLRARNAFAVVLNDER